MKGKIILITGPMFSGKTTELIRLGKRYKIAGKKCIFLKYKNDARYCEGEKTLSTHDKYSIQANPIDSLEEREGFDEFDVILIDEGQFYKGLSDFCNYYADKGKVVIVSALNGKSDRTPWEEISLLFPYVTRIRFLNSVCNQCTKSAQFSHFKKGDKGEIVIGGEDLYEPLCRFCYSEKNKQ